jgi:Ca2+-binding RTX toxin-like protein
MAISGDGVSLYTAAQFDSAIATFDVTPATGAITFDSCVTGSVFVACTPIPSATDAAPFLGDQSGLEGVETIARSADDRSLYGAAENDDAVSTFAREPVPPLEPDVPTARCQGDTIPKQEGTNGADDLTGTSGKDAIFGLGGRDRIRGIGGPDCLDGDAGGDTANGGGGKDRVKGEGGGDKLRGQGGKDRLNGGGGKDKLDGGKKADSLRGGSGKDKLVGGPAKDKLRGNGGKDVIVSGGGKDKINCGAGRDRVNAGPKDKVASNCERVR